MWQKRLEHRDVIAHIFQWSYVLQGVIKKFVVACILQSPNRSLVYIRVAVASGTCLMAAFKSDGVAVTWGNVGCGSNGSAVAEQLVAVVHIVSDDFDLKLNDVSSLGGCIRRPGIEPPVCVCV